MIIPVEGSNIKSQRERESMSVCFVYVRCVSTGNGITHRSASLFFIHLLSPHLFVRLLGVLAVVDVRGATQQHTKEEEEEALYCEGEEGKICRLFLLAYHRSNNSLSLSLSLFIHPWRFWLIRRERELWAFVLCGRALVILWNVIQSGRRRLASRAARGGFISGAPSSQQRTRKTRH